MHLDVYQHWPYGQNTKALDMKKVRRALKIEHSKAQFFSLLIFKIPY